MSYFGRNIKKIRTAKKISQTAFADLFNLKRGSVGAYEEGRAEAKIDTVIEIASFYKLTVDQLLCKELTFNEIYHISEIKQKFEFESKQNFIENEIPLIKEKDRFEFIQKFDNLQYLRGLQSIKIPQNIPQSLAFQHIGSSISANILGIKHGDILIANPVQFNHSVKLSEQQIYIILENENLHTCLTCDEGESFRLKFESSDYFQIAIKKSDIRIIWKVHQLISNVLPISQNLEISLQNIEKKIDMILKMKGI